MTAPIGTVLTTGPSRRELPAALVHCPGHQCLLLREQHDTARIPKRLRAHHSRGQDLLDHPRLPGTGGTCRGRSGPRPAPAIPAGSPARPPRTARRHATSSAEYAGDRKRPQRHRTGHAGQRCARCRTTARTPDTAAPASARALVGNDSPTQPAARDPWPRAAAGSVRSWPGTSLPGWGADPDPLPWATPELSRPLRSASHYRSLSATTGRSAGARRDSTQRRGSSRLARSLSRPPHRGHSVSTRLPGISARKPQTAPDLVGSITKQAVSGPRKTHSHHFAGPSLSRGEKTRHVVSSACRYHEARDRAVTASVSGASQQRPGLRARPGQRRRGDLRACRARPATREFWLRSATNRSVSSIAMNPFVKRPFPIAFGGPGAITVAGPGTRRPTYSAGGSAPTAARPPASPTAPRTSHPEQRERLPAPRATVPAPREVPGHLEPGQVRVIPARPARAPEPRFPRSGPSAQPAAGIPGTAGRLRARPLRRAPEHHPLQDRQASTQLIQLDGLLPVLRAQPRVLLRVLRAQPRVLLRVLRAQPRVLLRAQPTILLAQLSRQPRYLPVRLQRSSQHIPQRCLRTLRTRDNASRNHHAAQQTPSAAADHAPRASVSQPTALADANTPSHEFRILTRRQPREHGSHKLCGVNHD
jgi:hypothetical protein